MSITAIANLVESQTPAAVAAARERALAEAEGRFKKTAEFVTKDGKHSFRAGKNVDYGTWDDRHYVKSDAGTWKHVEGHGYDGHDSQEDAHAAAKGNAAQYDARVGTTKEDLCLTDFLAVTLDENVTPEAKAVGKSIKSWSKEIGAPLRVRSLGGKAQFVQAWQHSDPPKNGAFHGVGEPVAYSKPIPDEHRKKALKVIYPNHPEMHDKTSAGNVGPGSITMHAHQWKEFFKGTPHEIKDDAPAAAPVKEGAAVSEAFEVPHYDGKKHVQITSFGKNLAGKGGMQGVISGEYTHDELKNFHANGVANAKKADYPTNLHRYAFQHGEGPGGKHVHFAGLSEAAPAGKNPDIRTALSASLHGAGFDGNGKFRSPGHALSVLSDTLAKHGLEFGSTHSIPTGQADGALHVPVAWKNPHEPMAPKDEENAGIHFTWHKHDQSPTGSHEALAYATGALHPPHDHEFLDFKKPYAVQSDRTGFVHSTHDTHADATAAAQALYKKHKLYANVVSSASALQRKENAEAAMAKVAVHEAAGFTGTFHWRSIGKDDIVERLDARTYRITRKDGRKGIATFEGTEYHDAVRHLGALATSAKRTTMNERMVAAAPKVADHEWKAANGYKVKWTKHPGAGLEIGVSSPEGHHVGGVHGGQLYVKKSKIQHREGAAKAWRQYTDKHPTHPSKDATFGGCAESIRADKVKIADPQTKRVIEWRIVSANAEKVIVEHPDTHRPHTFPLAAVVG